ncbi:MAG: hypothetical protein EXQ84_05515 [Rhodospirillaceae bacterium]|nr:hypothetical protein [Rhodospirillaceae bacterium]
MSDTSAPPAANDGMPPPMFYIQPEPLMPNVHKDLKIRPETDFAFAATTNTIPITVPEFPLVARHFPIMFLGPELVPTAAVGFNPDTNLFVDAKGQWERMSYIPAYVRRYPFILLGQDGDERLHLGVDSSARSAKEGARALFENDKETAAVPQALTFCEQFHNAFMVTREFSLAMKASGIVEERDLELELAPGQISKVGSFQRVSEEKFKALPDATILDWHKKGILHSVYFHLQSLNNWDMLLIKGAERNGTS